MKPMMFLAAAAVIAVPATAQVMAPTDYVTAAGASDMYEKESSRLVLQTTKDPKIRSFAQMMIKDHTKSTADVKAAARRAKVTVPPPALLPPQAEMIAQLRAAEGPARDTTYVAQQRTAHQQALELHQSYAAQGSEAPLKAAAAKIAPVVQHHLEMLQSM